MPVGSVLRSSVTGTAKGSRIVAHGRPAFQVSCLYSADRLEEARNVAMEASFENRQPVNKGNRLIDGNKCPVCIGLVSVGWCEG